MILLTQIEIIGGETMRGWLKKIREDKQISQYEAADLVGISQSYYAAIETGARGNPLSVTAAKKIAAAFGFDWTRFYEEEAPPACEDSKV
jgi:transcriptional regulator with XRE-family HTH domain